jgi:8-oxo-dGTP pyrophosphatase MutT (NUDIX family)
MPVAAFFMEVPEVPLPITPLSKLPHFDPRKIPVLGVDSHLPAVTGVSLLPSALRQRFIAPPPWTPELRSEIKFADRAPMHAAVLLPIVMHERPTVLLTERTAHLSTHSGQIAFPGGKVDADDLDPTSTALREAWEEVGLAEDFVQVLGTLPTYTTGTSFIVTPVVALVRPGFSVVPNPYEVADVFEVPLEFLMNPANHQRHAFEWEGVRREWFSMRYEDPVAERFIWGATAGMLRNFYRFLSA